MTGAGTEANTLEGLLERLRERVGLTFPANRHAQVLEAAVAEAALRKAAGLDAYAALLDRDAAAFDALVARLTVGETYFFREPAHYAFLAETIVPRTLALRGEQHVFRAWSAGCASGEEAWSIAMLLASRSPGLRHRVLGTDVSVRALARAKEGRYRPWSLRGSGMAQALAWLEREGPLYVIPERLRGSVLFDYLNLAGDAYPSFSNGTWGLDVIFCRNVLIYFDERTIARVARGLHEALAEGGWLLTGSSDPPLSAYAPFQVTSTPMGVFYRRPLAKERQERADPGARTAFAPDDRHGDEPAPAWSPEPPLVTGMPSLGRLKRTSAGARAPDRDVATPANAPAAAAAAARAAFSRGEYRQAAREASAAGHGQGVCGLRVRALGNTGDLAAAEQAARDEVAAHPSEPELHFLHAGVLLAAGRRADADAALRKVLYLDGDMAVAHFLLGSIRETAGNSTAAGRAYRRARDLAAARPADERLPLGDGETADALRASASNRLAILREVSG